jgi:transcriptional regulator with XRE-family HTH domain
MVKVSTTEDIGVIARQQRHRLRISQAQLAARAGVTRQWLTRFERGNAEVSLSKVFAVLRELDLRVRLDAAEDVDNRLLAPTYESPRITMPAVDRSSLEPVKARIAALTTVTAVDDE